MELPQIEVIAGKYRLLRKLGQGGMGSVWYAEHLTLRSPVAIKLIDPSIADNAEALGRFLREAQSAASLRSPHVVQILDHGVDNGVPYIAMELLDGESLADRLERVRRLSPSETARILQQVGRAIGRAHEAGIVHRDLKPDNIYLVRNDDDEIAKVLDFGIAKSSAHGGLGAPASGGTRTGAVLGTPYYMSPEQAEGAKTLDGRADIWAMGVIAFECLLGSRPFDEETLGGLLLAICARQMPIPSQRGPTPPGFDQWFAHACARDVTQRFSSARDAAAGLRQVCEAAAGDTGNYLGAPNSVGGHLSSSTPGLSQANPVTASVSGQSLPGFSSTQVEQPAGVPRKGGAGLILALIGAGVLVAGGLLAWTRFGGGASSAVASASAGPALSAAPTSAPEQVATVPSVQPSPSATPSVVAQEPPTAVAPTPAKPKLAPAVHSAAPKPRPGASHPAAVPVAPVVAPAPVAAPPPVAKPVAKPAAADTNLGI